MAGKKSPSYRPKFCRQRRRPAAATGMGRFHATNAAFPVRCHVFHIEVEIRPGIFQVCEKIKFSVNLAFVNGKVLDVAGFDLLEHARPGMGMQVFVIGGFVRFQPGDPCEAHRRSRGCATGEQAKHGHANQGLNVFHIVIEKSGTRPRIPTTQRRRPHGNCPTRFRSPARAMVRANRTRPAIGPLASAVRER